MCGIGGVVQGLPTPIDELRLRTMARSMRHRGPDDEGVFLDGRVGLAHRRLSILDPSPSGRQPMSNRDGSVWIVYNGETYNFRELRQALGDEPPYQGHSDTEVVLRAYERYGTSFVERLRGIFALAIYDGRKRTLLLARDRFGVKPLYYVHNGGTFSFASEFKALIAAGLKPEFDSMAALDWVFTGWTADDRCLLKGVRRVPPGCILQYSVDKHELQIHRYYEPIPASSLEVELRHCSDHVGALEHVLDDAVRRQLVSDVPVGTFCSGGVDSSLITALASRHDRDIVAYNVKIADSPDHDESAYAHRVAEHLDIRLRTFPLTKATFRKHVVDTIYHVEYPLSFENAVPLYLVSKLAYDDGVRVLLSGEGADEQFGGYLGLMRNAAYRCFLEARGPLFGRIFDALVCGAGRLLQRTVGASVPDPERPGFHEVLCGRYRHVLTRNRAAQQLAARGRVGTDQALEAELLTQFQTYLLPILHRTDRASMMASIEARVPYLDEEVVAFAQALPTHWKVRPTWRTVTTKFILKQLARRLLPREVVDRPKMGFGVPLNYHAAPLPRSWLAEGFVTRYFNLSEGYLSKWLDSTQNRDRWMFTALEIWGQLFFMQRSPRELTAEYVHAS